MSVDDKYESANLYPLVRELLYVEPALAARGRSMIVDSPTYISTMLVGVRLVVRPIPLRAIGTY